MFYFAFVGFGLPRDSEVAGTYDKDCGTQMHFVRSNVTFKKHSSHFKGLLNAFLSLFQNIRLNFFKRKRGGGGSIYTTVQIV